MLKKVLSVILAFVLAVGAFSVATFAQSSERQMVDVEVVKVPLKSRIAFDGETNLEGIVLKVTYPDGKTENLTVEKSDSGDYYVAGDFELYYGWSLGIVELHFYSYGKETERFSILSSGSDGQDFAGRFEFDYINLPSFGAIFQFLMFLIQI